MSLYRVQDPWWPSVNIYGEPIVQPYANPYYPHWPYAVGQEDKGIPGGAGGALFFVGGIVLLGFGAYYLAKMEQKYA